MSVVDADAATDDETSEDPLVLTERGEDEEVVVEGLEAETEETLEAHAEDEDGFQSR